MRRVLPVLLRTSSAYIMLPRPNTVAYPGPCTYVCDSGKPPVCSWFCRSFPERLRFHPLPMRGHHFVLRSH